MYKNGYTTSTEESDNASASQEQPISIINPSPTPRDSETDANTIVEVQPTGVFRPPAPRVVQPIMDNSVIL